MALGNDSRLHSVDSLRGLAAFAVMWFHFTNAGSLLNDGGPFSSFVRASGTNGWLGVQVFFVISGFVLPHAMNRRNYRLRNYWRFMGKRALRLEPPYLVSVAATVVLWVWSSKVPGFQGQEFVFDWRQLALHVGYLNAFSDYDWYNPVYWTLAVELQFYLLIALIFPILFCRKASVGVALTATLGLLSLLPVASAHLPRHLSLFALGIAAAQCSASTISRRAYLALVVLLCGLTVVSQGWMEALAGGVAVSVVSASFLPISIGPLKGLLEWRPLLWLGSVSYSVYLFHVPIGGRVRNLGTRFATEPLEQALVLLLAVGVTLVAAWLVYLFVERPSAQLSSSITYPNELQQE